MKRLIFFAVCTLGLLFCMPAQSQILKKIGKKVERSVNRRLDNKTNNAVEKSLDKVEEGVINAGKDGGNNPSQTSSSNQNTTAGAVKAAFDVDGNYDFVPGTRTIFEERFETEQLGNFPRRLDFIRGNLEVVDWNGERYGRIKGETRFAITLPENLPETFTIQFVLHDAYWLGHATMSTTEKINDGDTYFQIYYRHDRVGVVTQKGGSSVGNSKPIENGAAPIEIMVDGSYAKMFVGGNRVANMPQTNIKRTNKLYFDFSVGTKDPKDFGYITNIRIAGGGKTLYQQLESEGRVAFHDIHFATGKADILPESSQTLQQIAELLSEHNNLKILIEGHTDNTGDFQKNMQLSNERAQSVKKYLTERHGIDAQRMNTMGAGQSRPIASNDTEDGRAKNRRVEIAKM